MVRLKLLPGVALVVMDSRLVFLLVDNFFGGGRYQAKVEGREFTPTENAVIERILDCVFKELSRAWGSSGIEVQLLQREMSPAAAHVYNMNDIGVINTFSIEFDVSGGHLHLVLPYSMVEPLNELLESLSSVNEEGKDNRWELALKRRMLEANVNLSCTVAETTVSLREVMEMDPGDVIPIGVPEPVLKANEISLFNVKMGRLKDQLALQVTDILQRQES